MFRWGMKGYSKGETTQIVIKKIQKYVPFSWVSSNILERFEIEEKLGVVIIMAFICIKCPVFLIIVANV